MSFFPPVFSACVSAHWQLGIGDPDLEGWTVFAAYALAAALAVAACHRAPFEAASHRRQQLFWALIGLLMAVLALNKQLDLQSLLTTAGRCLSKEQGWYAERRLVQRDFILALVVWAGLSAAALIWMLRGILRQNALPLMGLGVLAGFVLTRGMHFYHVFEPETAAADRAVHVLTTALEVAAPVLIGLAAWRALRRPHRQGPRPQQG